MTDHRYLLEITERCPVNPNVRMGEVSGDAFALASPLFLVGNVYDGWV
jgi:hypothetical protein